ncbi:MAG TPA: TIR domain-containing protein [Sporichthya sp.]|nr:TIR domain-containing protein [Sporichthya sp.]
MDIDAIRPGDDFVEVIERVLAESDVVITLIGRQWLTVTDEHGRRRIDDPGDFVRLEVETLTRNAKIVPVLVQGAAMPAPDELPPVLAPLSRRNAFDLFDRRWSSDIAALVRALEGLAQHDGESTGAAPRDSAVGGPPQNLPRSRSSFVGRAARLVDSNSRHLDGTRARSQ